MPVTKESIGAANDRPFHEVNITEWGGKIRVITMSAGDRDSWENGQYDKKIEGDKVVFLTKREHMRARLMVRCLADEYGKMIYSTSEEDVIALSQRSGAILDQLYARALRLNKLRQSDLAELQKNLESDPS